MPNKSKKNIDLLGVIVILTLLITMISWQGMDNVKTGVHHLEIANQMVKDTLELRRAEKNYIIRHQQQYIDQVMKIIRKLKTLTQQVKKQVHNQNYKNNLAIIIKLLNDYEVAFNNFIILKIRLTNNKKSTEIYHWQYNNSIEIKDFPLTINQDNQLEEAKKLMILVARELLSHCEQFYYQQKMDINKLINFTTMLVCIDTFIAIALTAIMIKKRN